MLCPWISHKQNLAIWNRRAQMHLFYDVYIVSYLSRRENRCFLKTISQHHLIDLISYLLRFTSYNHCDLKTNFISIIHGMDSATELSSSDIKKVWWTFYSAKNQKLRHWFQQHEVNRMLTVSSSMFKWGVKPSPLSHSTAKK